MTRFKLCAAFSTVLSLCLLLPLPAMAQRGGHAGGGMRAGRSSGFAGRVSGFHGGFGGFVGSSGFRGGFIGARGFLGRPFFRGRDRVFVSSTFFGFPSFGFYAGYGYDYWPYYYSPAYVYYPQYPPPVYTIDRPIDQGGQQQPSQRTAPAERYWLVALKDGTILAVTDYWLEGATLHYLSRSGSESTVEYAQVDLDFTNRLNRDRGMEFQAPRTKDQYQPKRYDAYGRPYSRSTAAGGN